MALRVFARVFLWGVSSCLFFVFIFLMFFSFNVLCVLVFDFHFCYASVLLSCVLSLRDLLACIYMRVYMCDGCTFVSVCLLF